MESVIFKKKLNLVNVVSKSFSLLLLSGLFSPSSAKAFFESQVQYAFENRWESMASDISVKKRFEVMRSFLVYPKLGLPVLRNSLLNSNSKNIRNEVATLIGMLGDMSDIPHMLKIWKQLGGEKRFDIWLGAMQRIYRRHRISKIVKPQLKRLYVNFLKKDFVGKKAKKNAILRYRIKNPSKSAIFLCISSHFWKTRIKENFPIEYLWLRPGEQIEAKKMIKLFPAKHTKDIRLDFRIWEVGINEELLHKTIDIPM